MTTQSSRSTGRPSRPRRARLDRDTILDAGLRLAAGGAADALSVRKLGAELGADPTAVYRHFRDKDALVEALLDRLLAEVVASLDPSANWRDRLRHTAFTAVDVLVAHPCIGLEAGARSTGGPAERDAIEAILDAFHEAGLDDESAVRFYGVLTGYIVAFATAMSAARLSQADTGSTLEAHWVEPFGRVDPVRHPQVARHADALSRLTTHDVLSTGIEVILDAAAQAGRPRRRR